MKSTKEILGLSGNNLDPNTADMRDFSNRSVAKIPSEPQINGAFDRDESTLNPIVADFYDPLNASPDWGVSRGGLVGLNGVSYMGMSYPLPSSIINGGYTVGHSGNITTPTEFLSDRWAVCLYLHSPTYAKYQLLHGNINGDMEANSLVSEASGYRLYGCTTLNDLVIYMDADNLYVRRYLNGSLTAVLQTISLWDWQEEQENIAFTMLGMVGNYLVVQNEIAVAAPNYSKLQTLVFELTGPDLDINLFEYRSYNSELTSTPATHTDYLKDGEVVSRITPATGLLPKLYSFPGPEVTDPTQTPLTITMCLGKPNPKRGEYSVKQLRGRWVAGGQLEYKWVAIKLAKSVAGVLSGTMSAPFTDDPYIKTICEYPKFTYKPDGGTPVEKSGFWAMSLASSVLTLKRYDSQGNSFGAQKMYTVLHPYTESSPVLLRADRTAIIFIDSVTLHVGKIWFV